MDTDTLIIHIKTKDFYKDIDDDVEKRLDTSNYEVDRPLSKGKNKQVIGLMKVELRDKIMIEFVALRPKTYSYLMNDDSEPKKVKGTKKSVIKRMLKLPDYKDCLLNNEIILRSQQRFDREIHNVYTEEINKTIKDDKMMIKNYRLMIRLHQNHAEQVLEKYVKQSY